MPDIKDLLNSVPMENSELSSLIKECKANKYALKKIEEFELSDEEIATYYPILMDYAEDQAARETCSGINDCSLKNPHHLCDLKMQGNVLIRVISYCPCYEKIIKRKKAYLRADFEDDLYNESAAKLMKLGNGKVILNRLANAFNSKEKRWSFISDSDHIALKYVVSYLNNAADRGLSLAFVDYPTFVENLKTLEKKDPEAAKKEKELLKNVDILALSNFGSEYKSDYARDAILMPILRERSIKKAETIFVSAYEIKDVKDLYSGSTSSSKMGAKELSNLLSSNVFQALEVKAGIEERF